MQTNVHVFWLCSVPMFAAMNPISIVPTFNAITDGLPAERIRGVILQSPIAGRGLAQFLVVPSL